MMPYSSCLKEIVKQVPVIFSDQLVESDLRAGHGKLVSKFIWDIDFKLMASWPLKNKFMH